MIDCDQDGRIFVSASRKLKDMTCIIPKVVWSDMATLVVLSSVLTDNQPNNLLVWATR